MRLWQSGKKEDDIIFALNKPECLCYECSPYGCQTRIVGCPDVEQSCWCEGMGYLTNSDCTASQICNPGFEASGSFFSSLGGCQQITAVATVTNTLAVPALLEASGGANDEILINGSVYEPGKYGFNWNAYGQPCGSQTGDNGSHSWSYSKVLAPGESVTFGGKDNGFGGNVSGNWTMRMCFEPMGSCCFSDGTCQEKNQTQCSQSGGTWQAGGTCSPNPCQQPTGACCTFDLTQCLDGKTEAECQPVGWWQGSGTSCSNDPCGISVGSCCVCNGECYNISEPDCDEVQFVWNGQTFVGGVYSESPNACQSGTCNPSLWGGDCDLF